MISLIHLTDLFPPYSFAFTTAPAIIPPSAVEDTPKNVFEGLTLLLTNVFPSNTTSYILENTPLPYLSLQKISNNLGQEYSCLSRIEAGIYKLSYFSESADDVNSKLDEIESALDYHSFPLEYPKKLNSLIWLNRKQTEIYPGIYRGDIFYSVDIYKSIRTDNLGVVLNGQTLFEALNARYEQYNIPETPFVSTHYQLENTKPPYITIVQLNTTESWRTSKSRIESNRFSFGGISESLQEAENIIDHLTYYFDYCAMRMPNSKRFTSLKWQGDYTTELYPGLWQCTIDYEMLVEKEIS